ncbi:SusD/RagB family nutrient-binding outer membrane lipoprotein [Myroides sp. LJL115]
MKRIKYLVLGLLVSSFTFQSCSEDKMDDINKDKNNPNDVESKYIITDMMVKSAFSITASDLAFYTSVYTELLGGAHAQMYNAQIREGEPSLAPTYNNSWNTIYSTIRNLNIIIEKCSPGGKEEGNLHTLGMAQVLKAYNMAILTDLFGDVPFGDAFDVYDSTSQLDKQENIYNEIFSLLDQAIANLESETHYPSIGRQDLIYQAAANSWVKTAYGLKARYTMRLSKVKPNYNEVIALVEKSFTDRKDEFIMQDAKVPYPFYTFAVQRTALFGSQTFYNVIAENDPKDPRLKDYFVPKITISEDKKDTLVQVNLVDASKPILQSQNAYSFSGLSSPGDVRNAQNAIYLLSMHELKFIEAEAYARLNNDQAAIKSLKEAIALGLNKRQTLTYPNYEYPGISSSLTGKALLEKIAQSKYIAFGEVEAIEAYNDIRRWKGMGEEFIPLRFPGKNTFPLRLTYGQSDVVSNQYITDAFGDGSYIYTENVWWAGGTR